jgi:hypothetical protein
VERDSFHQGTAVSKLPTNTNATVSGLTYFIFERLKIAFVLGGS